VCVQENTFFRLSQPQRKSLAWSLGSLLKLGPFDTNLLGLFDTRVSLGALGRREEVLSYLSDTGCVTPLRSAARVSDPSAPLPVANSLYCTGACV
jgi:hypothetical protein